MSRGFLLWSIALGLPLGILFAAYPLLDVEIADWFFDMRPASSRFPSPTSLVRQFANWVPFLLMLPPLFAVLRKLVFPNAPVSMALVVLIGFPDRPWPHLQSAAQGELGQAAA